MPSCTVTINLKAKSIISNIQLVSTSRLPICSKIQSGQSSAPTSLSLPSTCNHLDLSTLDAGTAQAVDVSYYLGATGDTSTSTNVNANMIPVDLWGELAASYANPQNAQRSVYFRVLLPLAVVAKYAVPKKEATFKVTLESPKPPVDLTDLFRGTF